eukprot:3002547-Pyramimonas_sp.AAC.1
MLYYLKGLKRVLSHWNAKVAHHTQTMTPDRVIDAICIVLPFVMVKRQLLTCVTWAEQRSVASTPKFSKILSSPPATNLPLPWGYTRTVVSSPTEVSTDRCDCH